MDNFFVVLPSNTPSSTSFENTNTQYEVKLTQPLNLTGQWEVGVTEVFLPPAKVEVEFIFKILVRMKLSTDNYKLIFTYNSLLVPYKSQDGKWYFDQKINNPEDQENEKRIKFCFIGQREDQIDPLNNPKWEGLSTYQTSKGYILRKSPIVPEYSNDGTQFLNNIFDSSYEKDFMKDLIRVSRNGKKFVCSFKPALVHNREDHIEVYFIPLPNLDHAETRLIFNKFGYQSDYHLKIHKDEYSFELLDKIEFNSDIIDLSINVIDYVNVGNIQKQLLRRIKRSNVYDVEHICYQNIQYVPVSRTSIDTIQVKLTSYDDGPAHIFDKCQVVLHFRKV